MSRRRVQLDVVAHRDHLAVSWSDGRAEGTCRFDRIAGAVPEWLGSAEDLTDGADRRTAGALLDALADWAHDHGQDVGVFHPDGTVERFRDAN